MKLPLFMLVAAFTFFYEIQWTIFPGSLLDSSHGSFYGRYDESTPFEKQYQLFASPEAFKFPIPESEAWKERVNSCFRDGYHSEVLIIKLLLPFECGVLFFFFPIGKKATSIAYGEGVCDGRAIQSRSAKANLFLYEFTLYGNATSTQSP